MQVAQSDGSGSWLGPIDRIQPTAAAVLPHGLSAAEAWEWDLK